MCNLLITVLIDPGPEFVTAVKTLPHFSFGRILGLKAEEDCGFLKMDRVFSSSFCGLSPVPLSLHKSFGGQNEGELRKIHNLQVAHQDPTFKFVEWVPLRS